VRVRAADEHGAARQRLLEDEAHARAAAGPAEFGQGVGAGYGGFGLGGKLGGVARQEGGLPR
jgi:hypothetical protein